MDERIGVLMDVIRAEAARRRITVKALAIAANVSYTAMRRYLNGERSMNLTQIFRVADALGVTLDYLTEEAARSERLAD